MPPLPLDPCACPRSIFNEVIRYPLRITHWYLAREDRLRTFLGPAPQAKLVAVGGSIVCVASVIIFLYGSNQAVLVLAYLANVAGSICTRVGLNFSHHSFFVSAFSPPVSPRGATATSTSATALVGGGSANASAPFSSHSHITSLQTVSVDVTDKKDDHLHAFADKMFAASEEEDTDGGTQAETPTVTEEEGELQVNGNMVGGDALYGFRRHFATEHFYRKRARQLALFTYVAFVPWLHLSYNKPFFPFNESFDFDSDSLQRVWIYFAIMIFYDLSESTFSRVVFNRELKFDTFSDAVAIMLKPKVFWAFVLCAMHITSDVYLALNRFRFCHQI